MRNILFPIKDASIYEVAPTKNTGIDEILEIGKLNNDRVRSLIQFDVDIISSMITVGTIPSNAKYFLNLFLAHTEELEPEQKIEIYPVFQSWTEGTGYFVENIENPANGASWLYRAGVKTNLTWDGGAWYTENEYTNTFQFDVPVNDLRCDITSLINYWATGLIVNNGIVLKIPDAQEQDSSIITKVSFFSNQTHTIFKPTLEIAWDDQSYTITGLSKANISDSFIGVKNLFEKYSLNSISRVNLSVRDKYPLKTFVNIFTRYGGTKYLPISSYYSIVDVQNNRTVIPFDDYSKISCDSLGSFFMLNTSGLYSTRQYKVLIKVVDGNTSQVFDTNTFFSIR